MGGPLPRYAPMLAELGELPDDDGGWAYEMKWDGVRAVAYLQDGHVRLLSRNDRDISPAYPELMGLAGTVGDAVALDGEIVAFDDRGRPSFRALQPRMHQRHEAKINALAAGTPVTYMIFDVLHIGDHPLIARPYTQRRDALTELDLNGDHWATPPAIDGTGTFAITESARLGMEGILAKRLDSPYRPGRRDPSWTKVKNFRTQEVVIIGWKPGEGRRQGRIGSLMLAVHDDDQRLTYVGNVGTGFTERTLDDLADLLAPLRRDDPAVPDVPRRETATARWVEPRLVGEVAFTERTGDDRLRHPSWRGLRADKTADQVHWE